ncbi:AVAST type 1 anti-phage system MBL fold metallo-hydrolase Avs1a [Sporosarcina psychrophila]|uniref:AVAST type 1 anti-phage system MBL fold metallo-hydrolase Avs1a n=1 Tax=Sporosarcina psychrophila TaxID=1476 RepID=UPI00078DDCF8|nr:AVAST type 1 anti-phage system MBL fold metallo-hydrolase Avs1a [Sporosarcina psychrophila]AMQ04987.1 hypothetical protein AZE41_02870 [Sporosarcina psychrophila]
MTNIYVEMFPASNGDSFLISCGDDQQINILIDSGFAATYKNYIRQRLIDLNEQDKRLKLMVITHIDSDHIFGALKLLSENENSETANIIPIDHIWHNSFRHLQVDYEKFKSNEESKLNRLLEGIVARGYPNEVTEELKQDKPIGARQGSSLASLIRIGGYSWNSHFDEKAVCIENQPYINLTDNIKITILSPSYKELEKLEKYWEKELYKLGYKEKITSSTFFDDAFEFLVSREKLRILNLQRNISKPNLTFENILNTEFIEDTSVTNGSSISFILQHNNKKILFLGDSHPSLIEQQLRLFFGDEVIWFDAIKISHHASSGNTSPSLLEIIDSSNFFVSTNGSRHGHPDLITLVQIVHRKIDGKRKLFFNYKTKASEFMDNEDRKKEYNYEIHYLGYKEIVKI